MADSQIILTKNRATLFPFPRPKGSHRNPIEFSLCIGMHSHCGCWVDIRNIAPEFNALVCRGCDLIIHIPIEIRTWNQLAAFMKKAREDDPS